MTKEKTMKYYFWQDMSNGGGFVDHVNVTEEEYYRLVDEEYGYADGEWNEWMAEVSKHE